VALAAVDQALLELMPNTSWNLLDAMLQRRAWGVETSTAQMEIIGRRHYGKKAVPAGGGGGRAQTRELLDTLLLWQPAIKLDANGQAKVTVPLNDALTTFKIVAVADASTGLFGTGATQIRATQDLQIISGLPPLVREDDQFRAQLTLRNTTKAAMKVEVAPRATLLSLDKQTVDIPAGESREVAWNVTAPAQLAQTRAEAILWEIEARDTVGARIMALAKAQGLFTGLGDSADITEVMARSIGAHLVGNDRIRLSGPSIPLSSQQAVGLSLALYELATNAAKYGDLASPQGVVDLSWSVREGDFALDWQESGGAEVVPPKREGFGSRLVNMIVPAYFDGQGRADYLPHGLHYRLRGQLTP